MLLKITKITCICLLSGFCLSGCASIVSAPYRQITLNSHPDQAKVTITDELGQKIFVGETPTLVTLKTRRGYFKGKSYKATITKEGFNEQVVNIRKRINGWYFGNFGFYSASVIGFVLIDPLTGAMWRLSPENVNVTLTAK